MSVSMAVVKGRFSKKVETVGVAIFLVLSIGTGISLWSSYWAQDQGTSATLLTKGITLIMSIGVAFFSIGFILVIIGWAWTFFRVLVIMLGKYFEKQQDK